MTSIDLNSDLGENTPGRIVGDDQAMLKIVSSANVACGFHAGYPAGIRQTLQYAADQSVTVGAHPGYDDFENFGRTPVQIEPAELQAQVEYQLGALMGLASAVGTKVRYVKPHGALYNTIAKDPVQAQAVADAIKAVDPSLVVLLLAGGVALEIAEASGLQVAAEAFADRAYHADGSLVSRQQEGSVLHDPQFVAERMLRLVETGCLESIEGEVVRLRADSICVHGDSPDAVAMAAKVKDTLIGAGVQIKPFVAK